MSNKYLDNLGLSTILKIISNLLKSTNRKMELEVGKVENNKVDKTVSGVLYNDSNLPYTSSINRTLGSSDTSPTLESCIISPNSTSKYSGVKLSNDKIHISQSSNQSGAGAMGDDSSLIILGGGYKRPSNSRLELYSRGAKYPDYTQVENDISLGDQELMLSSSRLSDASHGITYLNNDAITITPTSTTIKNLVEPINSSDAATKQYVDSHSGGGSVTVDDSLSTISTNPVQNRVITNALGLQLIFRANISYDEELQYYYWDGVQVVKGDIETVHQVLATNPNAFVDVKVYICTHPNDSEYSFKYAPVDRVDISSDGYVDSGSIYGNFEEYNISYLISWGSDYVPSINLPIG